MLLLLLPHAPSQVDDRALGGAQTSSETVSGGPSTMTWVFVSIAAVLLLVAIIGGVYACLRRRRLQQPQMHAQQDGRPGSYRWQQPGWQHPGGQTVGYPVGYPPAASGGGWGRVGSRGRVG